MFQIGCLWIIDHEKEEYVMNRVFPTSGFLDVEFNPGEFLKEYMKSFKKNLNANRKNKSFSVCHICGMFPIVSVTRFKVSCLAFTRVNEIEKKWKGKGKGKNKQAFLSDDLNDLDLLKLPQIVGTYKILEDITMRYHKLNKKLGKTIINYLQMFIGQAMPFGRPLLTNPDSLHEILTKKFSEGNISKNNKIQPAWKTHEMLIKENKQSIVFLIREYLKGYYHSKRDEKAKKKKNVMNSLKCYGHIVCRCEIAKIPNVSLILQSDRFKSVHFGTCCTNSSSSLKKVKNPKKEVRIEFTPENNSFVLCKYELDEKMVLKSPIRGILQMKELSDYKIKFLLQLKTENVKFILEYCNVIFPFPNRTSIEQYKFDNHFGMISLSNDSRKLFWKIGPRFQKQEISLSGTISFSKEEDIKKVKRKDYYIQGNVMYVKLKYKILNQTLSNLRITDFTVSPNTKIQGIQIQKETKSSKVKIWNSLADFRYSANPVQKT